MPQNPLLNYVAVNAAGKGVPLKANASGELITSGNIGLSTVLDISTETVVKATPGTLNRIAVIAGGTSPGTIYDASGTAAIAGSLEIAVLGTTTTGFVDVQWPCANGIVVAPGTSMVLGVAFT